MNGSVGSTGSRRISGYALRQVRRSPGFAAVVIATLALGIGGTTAVFSVVQAVLLAPLPYDEPGQLVRFYQQEPDKPDTRQRHRRRALQRSARAAASFEDVAALRHYSETGLDLVRDGRGQRLRVLRVTSEYFRTLRSPPVARPRLRARRRSRHAPCRAERRALAHTLRRRSGDRRHAPSA